MKNYLKVRKRPILWTRVKRQPLKPLKIAINIIIIILKNRKRVKDVNKSTKQTVILFTCRQKSRSLHRNGELITIRLLTII